MKKILIFGATGGLGSCLTKKFNDKDCIVIPISSSEINFNSEDSSEKISKVIDENKPEIIINCAGVLGHNREDFNKIFNINVRSNWLIANYFISNPTKITTTKVIFIGSSSYQKGKKDYILYASSKAALFNLFEGVSSYFENSKIIFGLINPSRIDTKMIAHLEKNPNLDYLDPNKLAGEILNFIESLTKSTFLNINK